MKNYRYVGPFDEVEIPVLAAVVSNGSTLEVHDPAVAEEFDARDDWEHVPDPKRSQAAKKAAETRADNDTEES